MNTKVIAIAALGTAGLLASVQALAHHSFAAEFDADKKLAMTGVVTKVEWTNPHVYFFIEVDADGGKFEEWAFEMGSPNGLMRRGWTRDTLEVGTEVIISGTRPRRQQQRQRADRDPGRKLPALVRRHQPARFRRRRQRQVRRLQAIIPALQHNKKRPPGLFFYARNSQIKGVGDVCSPARC